MHPHATMAYSHPSIYSYAKTSPDHPSLHVLYMHCPTSSTNTNHFLSFSPKHFITTPLLFHTTTLQQWPSSQPSQLSLQPFCSLPTPQPTAASLARAAASSFSNNSSSTIARCTWGCNASQDVLTAIPLTKASTFSCVAVSWSRWTEGADVMGWTWRWGSWWEKNKVSRKSKRWCRWLRTCQINATWSPAAVKWKCFRSGSRELAMHARMDVYLQ